MSSLAFATSRLLVGWPQSQSMRVTFTPDLVLVGTTPNRRIAAHKRVKQVLLGRFTVKDWL